MANLLLINISIIPRIKNETLLRCYFYMNQNIQGDFQICISVPLSLNAEKLTCNTNNIIDFNRYSNYDKVLRITAWILRSICNLKGVKTQKTINESILKPNELKEAVKILVKAN